jgi:hypothetical protein
MISLKTKKLENIGKLSCVKSSLEGWRLSGGFRKRNGDPIVI